MGSRNKKPDGVDTYPETAEQAATYERAEAELAQLWIPVLLHADNPHERLYIAAQDGTGNSLYKDAPERRSIVAQVHEQVLSLKKQGTHNIASGYVEGIYTQDNPLKRLPDGVSGYTFERRVETAYHQFCVQAKAWIDEDPNAQIRVAGIGFSRGAEQTAALLRVIHERGIQDPTDAKIVRDKDGLITHAQYTRPPLVPPGRTIQAALLLDPVATGIKEHDRRLPASAMSVYQITAQDERRDQFKGTDHIPPGFSENYRSLNSSVGGGHSNIGDTYSLNAIGIRNFNLSAEFINRLTDGQTLIEKRPMPEDPAMYRVHRTEQHALFYTTRGYDKDGLRDHVTDLGPSAQCRTGEVRDCHTKDPMSPELEQQLERRTAPMPLAPGQQEPVQESGTQETGRYPAAPRSEMDDLIDQLYNASLGNDPTAWNKAAQSVSDQYMASPPGQAWQQEVQQYGQAQRQQEQQEALEAQQQMAARQTQQETHKPHVMRM